ncbi:MAG: hypothetical protein UZ15_CFX003002252 [Chloroflexi bacterium OLB15]|nr:MAG: hypothetical protein UZ15_CFX003002252 [Chloroflexi bacterium OLB15]
MSKILCFADENGLETRGRIFIVAVLAVQLESQTLEELCEEFEQKSGKGRQKWRKTNHIQRMEYIRFVFQSAYLEGKLFYSVYRNWQDYDTAIVQTLAKTLIQSKTLQSKAAIFIDALSKSKRHNYGTRLRRLGISVQKVQGIANEESSAPMRLVDALAGFVRDAIDGESDEITKIFERAKAKKQIIEL